jgi:predicted alpha/beta hydrolase family esterase
MAGEMPAALLILPGYNGSGPEHWQTKWERDLPGARRVPAKDWDHPVCKDWVAALELAVAEAGPDTILVAHSLGCLQVAHWAATTKRKIRGALLVAPPDPDRPAFPTEIVGFQPLPRRPLGFPSVLVASHDDSYSTLTFSRALAAAWGSEFIDAGPCGHINAGSGLGDWPMGKKCLGRLLGAVPGRPAQPG